MWKRFKYCCQTLTLQPLFFLCDCAPERPMLLLTVQSNDDTLLTTLKENNDLQCASAHHLHLFFLVFPWNYLVHSVLPGLAHRPRAWWVLKKRRHDDLTAWLLCSFPQETPLNIGAEQLAATTRRRLAMMHTHPTRTPGGAEQDRQHPSWRQRRNRGGWRCVTEGKRVNISCQCHCQYSHLKVFTISCATKYIYSAPF